MDDRGLQPTSSEAERAAMAELRSLTGAPSNAEAVFVAVHYLRWMQRGWPIDPPVVRREEWTYLARGADRHWRQPVFKDRRKLTPSDVVEDMKANGRTEQETALNWDLPVEAVREAIRYYEENRDLIEREDVQALVRFRKLQESIEDPAR